MTRDMRKCWTEEGYFTKEEVDKFIKAAASDVILSILNSDDEKETVEDRYMQIHGIVKLAKMIFSFTEDEEEEETTNEHS